MRAVENFQTSYFASVTPINETLFAIVNFHKHLNSPTSAETVEF